MPHNRLRTFHAARKPGDRCYICGLLPRGKQPLRESTSHLYCCCNLQGREQTQTDEQSDEHAVVCRANTSVEPRTMVIEDFHAFVASAGAAHVAECLCARESRSIWEEDKSLGRGCTMQSCDHGIARWTSSPYATASRGRVASGLAAHSGRMCLCANPHSSRMGQLMLRASSIYSVDLRQCLLRRFTYASQW